VGSQGKVRNEQLFDIGKKGKVCPGTGHENPEVGVDV
jgi:hypothetical protein